MMREKLYSNRIIRFAFIGICNASISFGVLNLAFYKLHTSKIISSIIGTTCALIFSFIMNRVFVFSDKSRKVHQQLIPFVIVTISGSIIILNIVYIISLVILKNHETFIINLAKDLSGIKFTKNFVDINVSTVIGSIVAMFWNYNGYKWFVFKGKIENEIEEPKISN